MNLQCIRNPFSVHEALQKREKEFIIRCKFTNLYFFQCTIETTWFSNLSFMPYNPFSPILAKILHLFYNYFTEYLMECVGKGRVTIDSKQVTSCDVVIYQ